MFRSVRTRLVLTYLLVGLTAALAVGLVTYLIAHSYFQQQEVEFLTRNADEIADDVRPVLERAEPHPTLIEVQQVLEDETRSAPIPMLDTALLQAATHFYSFMGQRRVVILDRGGKVLADSRATPSFRWIELLPRFAEPLDLGSLRAGRSDVASLALRLSPREIYQVISHAFPVDSGQFSARYSLSTGVGETKRSALMVRLVGAYPYGSAEADAPSGAVSASDVAVKVAVDDQDGDRLGYIQLSDGPAYGQPILHGIRLALAGGVAAAVLLAVAVGLLSARQINRPLALLGAAAEKMAAGDLAARAPAHRRDEFGQLARRFNAMAQRLQTTVERLRADREALRRFVADASHELRTPLTALKTFNSVLLWDPRLSQEPHAEMLQASAEQIERLDSLTQGLLELSRLDAELSPEEFIRDDLRTLAERAEAAFRPLMRDNRLELTLDLPADRAVTYHDPVCLRRAVDNLLSNALRFSPAGGQVKLGVEKGEGEIRISVWNSGPSIPPDELPFIFDRFYRGEMAAGTEGSGLGLAIVQAVAKAHSGRVTVDCSDGCRFTLHLPERLNRPGAD